MIVVDTNIISYSLIQGDKTESVLRAHEKDSAWIVPVLWRHEFLNVLSTLTKNNILNQNQSIDIWKNAVRIFNRNEYNVDMVAALDISIQNKVSSYDAQYITLAKTLAAIKL